MYKLLIVAMILTGTIWAGEPNNKEEMKKITQNNAYLRNSLDRIATKTKREEEELAKAKRNYEEAMAKIKEDTIEIYKIAMKKYTKKGDIRSATVLMNQIDMLKNSVPVVSKIPVDAKEFEGHHYKIFKEAITWDEAKKKCETMGGYLACIDNKDENEFLKNLGENTPLWIGGSDNKKENEWRWVNDKKFKYQDWNSDEPNNSGNIEHYLAFWYKRKINKYAWADLSLNASVVGFVCEWD